jgi:hypothetical protein
MNEFTLEPAPLGHLCKRLSRLINVDLQYTFGRVDSVEWTVAQGWLSSHGFGSSQPESNACEQVVT